MLEAKGCQVNCNHSRSHNILQNGRRNKLNGWRVNLIILKNGSKSVKYDGRIFIPPQQTNTKMVWLKFMTCPQWITKLIPIFIPKRNSWVISSLFFIQKRHYQDKNTQVQRGNGYQLKTHWRWCQKIQTNYSYSIGWRKSIRCAHI